MDAALAEWSGEIAAEVLQPQADQGGEGAVRLARRPARDRHGIRQDGHAVRRRAGQAVPWPRKLTLRELDESNKEKRAQVIELSEKLKEGRCSSPR